MRVMVVGGGGREHAIIKKLKENPHIEDIFAVPGNGGIGYDAICVEDIKATDVDAIVSYAMDHSIDFAVVAPDDPLVLGCVDRLEEKGIPCFGPNKAAAIIEGSKVFSKNLMKKYNIPTAGYEIFDDPAKALVYIEAQNTYPTVIKADGLALGKGVILAENYQQAQKAVTEIMEDKVFGASGNHIVVEEFLTGPEVSVLAFTDSKTLVPMVSSMDHKRALDNDMGLNTGGMGTIAPNPYYTRELAAQCMEEIFLPTMNAMNAVGRPFKGCLYFGLMLTPKGPKVIEYNCRFGDPETQVVLPLLKSDLLTIMQAVHDERLAEVDVTFSRGAACCVILASGGYPVQYQKGYPVRGLNVNAGLENSLVFHSGTQLQNGKLVTNGGRVLGVTATSDYLALAINKAYREVEKVNFTDMHYRTDIGQRALNV
ncbi:MAG: phosphoribosylamine--glycine ligase [Oscillospiraceae bacterium]|nr:phosphoribosylamine--glycine ligase [Oscillospiraceae bacterium]